MYEEYAELTRRMDAAVATRKTAKDEYDEALKERDILVRDFEIGTHTVSGGKVVVTGCVKDGECSTVVKLIEVDKKTQEFADRYVVHCRSVADARERAAKAVTSRTRITDARNAYWYKFQDQLINGKYTVQGGTVTITALGAVFNASDIDTITQMFAERYAKYHATLSVKEDRITEEQMQQRVMDFEQNAYSEKFRRALTDGIYTVDGGTVTISHGEVTFTQGI